MGDTFPYPSDDRGWRGRRWVKVVVIVAVLLALVILVVRLTGDGDSGGGFGPGSHKPPAGAGDQAPGAGGQTPGTFSSEQMDEFVECLRQQGMDVDTQVGDNGQVEMNPPPGVDPNGPEFQEALAACRAEVDQGGGQPPGGGHG